MPSKRRGAYQYKVILGVKETALGWTIPIELRKKFHRLLQSVWREERDAAEKRRPQLDALLDRLYAKRCQLPLVFEASYAAATTAMVDRGRAHAREKARIQMERQNALLKRLERDHRILQRRLAQSTFPAPPNLARRARQLSEVFLALFPHLEISVHPLRRPRGGRPPKRLWRNPSHKALQKAGVSVRDETSLYRLFNL